jgi:hypothetical protein
MHRLVEHPAFIKVVPVKDRAKVILDVLFELDAIYHAADYTSFEGHFTKDVMSISHDFMLHMLGGLKVKNLLFVENVLGYMEGVLDGAMFNSILENIITNRRVCEMRNFGSVSVIARRMSGEMDTSLSNSYTNYVMTQYVGFVYQKVNTQNSPVL